MCYHSGIEVAAHFISCVDLQMAEHFLEGKLETLETLCWIMMCVPALLYRKLSSRQGQTSEKRLAESLTVLTAASRGLTVSEHLLLSECEVPVASILVTVGAFMAQAGKDDNDSLRVTLLGRLKCRPAAALDLGCRCSNSGS